MHFNASLLMKSEDVMKWKENLVSCQFFFCIIFIKFASFINYYAYFWLITSLIIYFVGFLEKEIKKDSIQMMSIGDNPEAPQPREMIDLEVLYSL